MVDVVEHEAEVARLADRRRRRLAWLDQPKPRGELARPKAGLMKTLAFAGAAIEKSRCLPSLSSGPALAVSSKCAG